MTPYIVSYKKGGEWHRVYAGSSRTDAWTAFHAEVAKGRTFVCLAEAK